MIKRQCGLQKIIHRMKNRLLAENSGMLLNRGSIPLVILIFDTN